MLHDTHKGWIHKLNAERSITVTLALKKDVCWLPVDFTRTTFAASEFTNALIFTDGINDEVMELLKDYKVCECCIGKLKWLIFGDLDVMPPLIPFGFFEDMKRNLKLIEVPDYDDSK